MPKAASLADGISKKYGITPKLIGGHGGIFTVEINGDPLFDNRSAGTRFPDEEEVLNLIGNYKAEAAEK